jgi:hypothetical protein
MPRAVLAVSGGPACSSQPTELIRSKKPCSTQPSRLWMYRSSQNLLASRRSLSSSPHPRDGTWGSGNVRCPAGAAHRDRAGLRAVTPDHARAHRAQEGGVQHPELTICADLHQPGKPLQQVGAGPAFVGNQRELVVLDLPAAGPDPRDQPGVGHRRSPRPIPLQDARQQHRHHTPRIVRDLLIDANIRLDIKTDSVPDETLLLRPRLPLPVAVRCPKEVVSREVVTLINGQKGMATTGTPSSWSRCTTPARSGMKATSASATRLLSARRPAMIDPSANRSSRRSELSTQAKVSRGCGMSLTPSTSWAIASTIGRCKTVPTAQLLHALRQGFHPPGPGTDPGARTPSAPQPP